MKSCLNRPLYVVSPANGYQRLRCGGNRMHVACLPFFVGMLNISWLHLNKAKFDETKCQSNVETLLLDTWKGIVVLYLLTRLRMDELCADRKWV